VKELVPPTLSLTIVDSQANFKQALNTLAGKKVLSAPIFDREERKFIGLVDVADLLAYAITLFAERELRSLQLTVQDFSVKSIRDVSARNPWAPFAETGTLYDLMVQFSKHRLRRVPLVNANGRVCGIVSQSRMVEFLWQHHDSLNPLAKLLSERTLGEAMSSPAKCVGLQSKTALAFATLIDEGISSIAVVDDQGHLVGSLSSNYLKGVDVDQIFEQFHLSVHDFVQLASGKMARPPGLGAMGALPSTATLKEGLQLLAERRLHRLWIVDADNKPLGVVSLSDLLSFVLRDDL
jgi:CBS-domain-containing membrane protein